MKVVDKPIKPKILDRQPVTLSNTKVIFQKRVEAIVQKAEDTGNKQYSKCVQDCLDDTNKLQGDMNLRYVPYRIHVRTV